VQVWDFKEVEFWQFDIKPEDAHKLIDEQAIKVKREKAVMESNANLCALFEFPELIDKSREHVEYMEKNLGYMTTLWNVIEEATDFYAESKLTLWAEVHAEDLEDESKRLMKITKNCAKDVRWSKAFTGIDKVNKDFLNTVPLIQALHHQSMRLRHWGYLAKATGHDFTPPPEDPTLTVGDLLSLNLHNFTADVEEICDQALKEEKMENQLTVLEEFWTKVDWLMDLYVGSDVPLLKMGEEEFEALENDQMVVQGMLASRYLAQFEATVHEWQHNLAMVAEVFLAVSDIQRTWSYLEPLFIHSDEVKKELPETAERFVGIDKGVRSMLYGLWETRNCVNGCVQDGLLKDCENIVVQLDICKKSLADFLVSTPSEKNDRRSYIH
jgi:dynein heavy chain